MLNCIGASLFSAVSVFDYVGGHYWIMAVHILLAALLVKQLHWNLQLLEKRAK